MSSTGVPAERLRTRSAAMPAEMTYEPEPLAGVPREYRPPAPSPDESVRRLLAHFQAQPGPSSRLDFTSPSQIPVAARQAYRAGVRMDPGAVSSQRLLAKEKSPGRPGDVTIVAKYRPGKATPEAAGVELTQDGHGNVYNVYVLSARELANHPLPAQDADALERSWDDYSSPSPLPVPAQDDSGAPVKKSVFEKVARGKRCPVKRRHAYTPPRVRTTAMKRKCVKKTPSPRKKVARRRRQTEDRPPTDDNNNAIETNTSEEVARLETQMRGVSMTANVDLDATITNLGGDCHQDSGDEGDQDDDGQRD